jgi:hypothetical protein
LLALGFIPVTGAALLAMLAFGAIQPAVRGPQPLLASLEAVGLYDRLPAVFSSLVYPALAPARRNPARAAFLPAQFVALDQPGWEALIGQTLRPEWLRARGTALVEQFYGQHLLAKAPTATLTIPLHSLLSELSGERGYLAARLVINAQRYCSTVELLEWRELAAPGDSDELPPCQPPPGLLEDASGALRRWQTGLLALLPHEIYLDLVERGPQGAAQAAMNSGFRRVAAALRSAPWLAAGAAAVILILQGWLLRGDTGAFLRVLGADLASAGLSGLAAAGLGGLWRSLLESWRPPAMLAPPGMPAVIVDLLLDVAREITRQPLAALAVQSLGLALAAGVLSSLINISAAIRKGG